MDKTGNSLNAPHLSDWLTGPWDDQPSYLCSSNHRWSQYRGPCAVSGHPGTRWLSRGGTKTPSRRSFRHQVTAGGGLRRRCRRSAHACRLLRRLGLEKQLRRAARRAFPLAAQLASGPAVTADPARGPCTLSGWAAALSAPLWFALALFSRHRFGN